MAKWKADIMKKKMQDIEKFLRKLCSYPLEFVYNYTTITVFAIIIFLSLVIGLSDGCNIFNLSYNKITQSEVEEIVEVINCAWSKRHKACFCVYANGGTIGGYVPDHVCSKNNY